MASTTDHRSSLGTLGEDGIRRITTMESYRIIETEMYPYILAILSLIWLSAQLPRKSKHLNAGCWFGWDALGFAVVAYLAQQKRWAVACIFTASFFVWTRLPGSPLNDFRLPSFEVFLKNSLNKPTSAATAQKPSQATNTTEQQPEPACIVCWSSDEKPATLPCNHLICHDCLTTMKTRRQTCCPLCRLMLFHNNDSLRCTIHKAAVAAFAARLTINGIYLILQLRHGLYWDVSKSALTYLPQFYCFRALYIVAATQGVEWWQFGLFDYLLPIPLPESRFARSVWPAFIAAILFSFGVFNELQRIRGVDLVVWRVVHDEPFTQLFARKG